MNKPVLIVTPAYNEVENLAQVLKQSQEALPSGKILVVDDGSSDQTADLAKSLGVPVLSHPFNLGYGAAIQTGIKYALKSGFDFVILVDADGQHDPSSIPALLSPCSSGEADLVVGSRFRDPRSYHPPFIRKLGMKFFALLTRILTNLSITDPTSGFIALNRKAMEKIASPDFPTEYPDANNLIWLHRSGLRITECPVLMHPSPARHHSMHQHRKGPYYFFFMFLSILVIKLRKK